MAKFSLLAVTLTLALGAFVWTSCTCISHSHTRKRLSPLYPAVAVVSAALSVVSCVAMLAI